MDIKKPEKIVSGGPEDPDWRVGLCSLCHNTRPESEGAVLLNLARHPEVSEPLAYACPECCAHAVARIMGAYEDYREFFAAVAHELWCDWVEQMLPLLGDKLKPDGRALEGLVELLQQWRTRSETPYGRLSENEKIIKREQADLILRALGVVREPAEVEYIGDADGTFTSARIKSEGPHDKVKLWNRGGLAGELVLNKGDGAGTVYALGLRPKEDRDDQYKA
jgi:hypothetical protein